MNTLKTLVVSLAAASLITITAQAAPITGHLSFSSEDSSWTGNTANVNTITTITSFGATTVDGRSGSFVNASSPIGAVVTMGTPLNFVTPVITNPLWSVGIFSFNLESITNINRIDNASGLDTLGLAGTGTIIAAGFDNTPGSWVWSGDLNGTAFFTFSSTTIAEQVSVPDGGSTLVILGASLMGLFGVARRFSRAA